MRFGIGGSSMGIGGSSMGIGGGGDNSTYTGGYGGPNSNGQSAVTPVIAASGSASGSVGSGQASLILLDAAIVGLIVFYLWTHSVQRGG